MYSTFLHTHSTVLFRQNSTADFVAACSKHNIDQSNIGFLFDAIKAHEYICPCFEILSILRAKWIMNGLQIL